jgi:hypothetical protein
LKDILTGYRLLSAATGEEALQLAMQEQPAHILIAIEPHGLQHGIGVLQQIRQTVKLVKELPGTKGRSHLSGIVYRHCNEARTNTYTCSDRGEQS